MKIIKKYLFLFIILCIVIIPKPSFSKGKISNNLFGAFAKTELKFKIVKITAYPRHNPKKFYITWQPSSEKNILKDVRIISKTVLKHYPKTKSILFRAIHPKYMRWSGYSIWSNTIIYNGTLKINLDF
jgi:hypothetical protein